MAHDVGAVLGGRGRSAEAARRVDSTRNQAGRRQDALADLEHDLAAELAEIETGWTAKAAVETVEVGLEKSDIRVTALSLVWVPVR